MKRKATGSPIFRKILILMSLLIGIEILLLISSIFGSGVTEQLNQNAKDILEERVNNRKNYLENEMLTNWSNIDRSVQSINKATMQLSQDGQIAIDQLDDGSDQSEPLVREISDELISLLRNHRVTGAFVVFNTEDLAETEQHQNKPGMYMRDLDPISAPSVNNTDLLLERGSAAMVEQLGISTDMGWRPRYDFEQNENYYPFFYEPFQKAYESKATSQDYIDYGYWSKGYTLYGETREVMSYSVPLILEDGTVYGVLGIDLTFDYLEKVLPYSEILEDKLGAYILSVKEETDETHEDVMVNGPIYTVSAKEQGAFYYSAQNLNIYNSNTPFSDQQWSLIGAVRRVDLFAFSEQVFHALVMSIVLTLLAGVLGGFLISKIVSRPIAVLYDSLNAMEAGKQVQLNRTGILEVDRLASAIEILNQEVIDSSTQFRQIIDMVSVRIGGFDYSSKEKNFFITEGFFSVFGRQESPKDIDEFAQIMETLLPYVIKKEANEVLFKIPLDLDYIYAKLKYLEDGIRYTGVVEDVTKTVLEQERIKHERDHDLLTGLINRRAFYRIMHRLFEQEPHKIKVAALLMLDLDNLKTVNDTYGHDLGDTYIRSAAECFREAVPEFTVVSRVSGDEFYIFLYGFECKEEIYVLIRQLENQIKGQVILMPNKEAYAIKVSGGIAWYPDDSKSFEELLKFSDFAMYKTKQTFKGVMNEFDIEVYQREQFLLQNKAELLDVLDKQLIQYHFQPIVSVASGEIYAYEALMRVDTPTRHSPDEVITLARLESRLDQVEAITWFKALEAYATHVRTQAIPEACKVFINSIPNQLPSTELIEKIEQQFKPYLQNIVMEVVESERIDEAVQNHKKLLLSRWNGSMALDDYGSGYNTEKNLLLLSPEYIKVDIEIVRDIDKDADKQKIMTNIISYAHERGMKIVAEGIENQSEAKAVAAMGVDYLQGYLLGRPALTPPVLSEEMKEFLRNM